MRTERITCGKALTIPLTLLLGMKLGVNHKAGWSLTSLFANDSPVSGPFILQWDTEGRRLGVRQKGKLIWTSRMHTLKMSHLRFSLPWAIIFITSMSQTLMRKTTLLTRLLIDDFWLQLFRRKEQINLEIGLQGPFHAIRLSCSCRHRIAIVTKVLEILSGRKFVESSDYSTAFRKDGR